MTTNYSCKGIQRLTESIIDLLHLYSTSHTTLPITICLNAKHPRMYRTNLAWNTSMVFAGLPESTGISLDVADLLLAERKVRLPCQ